MTAAARSISDTLGPVPVLMNNAGTGAGGNVFADVAVWQQVIGVHLMGVLHGVQAFVPDMLARGEAGLVVNTGSKQGITQQPGNTADNVSKSGVKALTEGLAHSLREQMGGRVTTHLLVPGFTYTGMIARRLPEKPPAAWTPEQVVELMMDRLAAWRLLQSLSRQYDHAGGGQNRGAADGERSVATGRLSRAGDGAPGRPASLQAASRPAARHPRTGADLTANDS